MEVGAKSAVICGKIMMLVLFAGSLNSLHMVCFMLYAIAAYLSYLAHGTFNQISRIRPIVLL
jgi:hypothetical protein